MPALLPEFMMEDWFIALLRYGSMAGSVLTAVLLVRLILRLRKRPDDRPGREG
jgi:hypothetical protein